MYSKGVPTDQPVTDGFPHYDRKYMCDRGCCGPVHCTTAAQRIGIFIAVALTVNVLGLFVILSQRGAFSFNEAFSIFLMTVQGTCVTLLFVGNKKHNPRMVMPMFIIFGFFIFLGAFVLIACLFGFLFPTSEFADYFLQHQEHSQWHQGHDSRRRAYFGSAVVFVLIPMLIWYWFFNIFYRCYTYQLDFENYRKRYEIPGGLEMGTQPPPYS